MKWTSSQWKTDRVYRPTRKSHWQVHLNYPLSVITHFRIRSIKLSRILNGCSWRKPNLMMWPFNERNRHFYNSHAMTLQRLIKKFYFFVQINPVRNKFNSTQLCFVDQNNGNAFKIMLQHFEFCIMIVIKEGFCKHILLENI